MKYIWIVLGSCVSNLAIASIHEFDVWTANLDLIKRTDSPPRRHNQLGRQSQPQNSPRSGRAIQVNIGELLKPSPPRKPISPKSEEAHESHVKVDVHGPGKFSGMPNSLEDPYQNHVSGGRRQGKTYHGSEEVSAKAVSYHYNQIQAPFRVPSAQDMIKIEAKGKKVEQSIAVPTSAAGHISILSPGEDSPISVPVPGGKHVKVIAQTPDSRGIQIKGVAQRGGEADAKATNAGSITGHRIGIEKMK